MRGRLESWRCPAFRGHQAIWNQSKGDTERAGQETWDVGAEEQGMLCREQTGTVAMLLTRHLAPRLQSPTVLEGTTPWPWSPKERRMHDVGDILGQLQCLREMRWAGRATRGERRRNSWEVGLFVVIKITDVINDFIISPSHQSCEVGTSGEQGFPTGSAVKNLPAVQEMRETWVQSLGREDPLGEEMATHSSILAWRIPMDRGAWQAAVHGVTKSQTLSMHACTYC